ncbi:DNA-3-methyladenine glycosylase I [Thalassolituus sp.]|jgi:DNA-3-methyladenine glycosylase I|uniref:DNA-3-methyladenine glycosylase I n=1 Tax=Thalassolituus sp. TaxID=2030822 RepID=UPI0035179A4D|nr:MAG: DNA-3-methyladenine glycosylase I [Thalassolituus sp.]
MELTPCSWAKGDLYLEYHDTEWGVPCYQPDRLFEKLCLEGQQAGLSWITVLKKRPCYRQRFHNFDPQRVAAMTDSDIDDCLSDAGLIRHRGKLEAIRKNARAWVAAEQKGHNWVEWLWSYVGGKPVINRLATLSDAPAQTDASAAMSKALKKMGFGFVGPTTCYAFMQSMGMVNDHLTSCPCHPDNQPNL